MNDKEKHFRKMNIGAHIAWGAAMWASAEVAKESKNYLNSVIGFYYSVFHLGFALINTDHSFHVDNMKRISHKKVEKWLETHLHFNENINYKILRIVRENINYLGMGSPASKLRIVRGHPFGYGFGYEKVDFFEMVEKASKSSKKIFDKLLGKIEVFCKQNHWQPLQFGREYYIEEYLSEDVLLNVLPREQDGIKVLKIASDLILGLIDKDINK